VWRCRVCSWLAPAGLPSIPVAALVIAFLLIRLYPLHPERMRVIRRDLEARRGAV
jgi:Na+/melibiose symporter-like transporter